MGFYLKIESRPSNNLENEGQSHCQGHSSINPFKNFCFKHFFI